MNMRCVDKYVTIISQLNVLVSHKPNLGSAKYEAFKIWDKSEDKRGGVEKLWATSLMSGSDICYLSDYIFKF